MSKSSGFSFGMGSHSNISANEIINTRSDKAKEEEVLVNSEIEEVSENNIEVNSEESSLLITKRKASTKKAESKVSTSLALNSKANNIINRVFELDDTMKANTTINKVLETCYDAETKSFKQDIPVKEIEKSFNYSIQIAKKYRDALAKEAKKRNMTVGEFLSELIIKTIKFD